MNRLSEWRFLLSRRWLIMALCVVAACYATWWLGNWQLDRLHSTRHDNGIIRANLAADPVDVGDVLTIGHNVTEAQQWMRVTARGHYETEKSVALLYQTDYHSTLGMDPLVPFLTDAGQTVIVDRGWFATQARELDASELPAPPSGEVTITGWLRQDGSGDATAVHGTAGARTTRAVSSASISKALGEPVLGGFVDLQTESPKAAKHLLTTNDFPALNDGPHLFYWLQWWFFGILFLCGTVYLAIEEHKTGVSPLVSKKDVDPDAPVDPEREAREAAKAARIASKKAVRAAYQAAYEREKQNQ